MSSGSKNEHTSKCWWGTKITITLASSLVKKVGDSTIADASSVCSNRRSWEYKCNHYISATIADRVHVKI